MLRLSVLTLAALSLFDLDQSYAQGPGKLTFPPREQPIPVWTVASPDAKTSLGEVTRANQDKVFLVMGVAGKRLVSIGTSWVISREHRLLATNAHVADLFDKYQTYVVQNGTRQKYPVIKTWYHPGVRRFLGTSRISVRSMNPKDGEVDPQCPDVAVLQLGPEGPDLPRPFPMAEPEALKTLYAQPVGMIGYPGHDNNLDPNQKAQATFHEGIVSRVTDFRFSTDCPENELQFVQHTIPDWGGFSGSPIYLANGQVVALHNMARPEKGSFDEIKVIPHGVRVDLLWELLIHHGLEGKVSAKFDRKAISLKRWLGPDQREEIFRKIVALVDEADYLVFTRKDFQKGISKCTQALSVHPEYAPAYRTLAFAYNNDWFENRRRMSREAAGKLLENAAKVIDIYAKLQASQVDVHLDYATILNNLGSHYKNPEPNRKALGILRNVLSVPHLTIAQKADTLSSMGVSLDNLDEDDEARQKHIEAVTLRPDAAYLWETFADFYRSNDGDQALIDSAMARAKALRDKRFPRGGWTEISSANGQLVAADVFGRVRPNAYYKVHTIDLQKGMIYQIDLTSPTMDTYLRIEDADGKALVDDDDTGGQLDSLIFFEPPANGTYRLVATTFPEWKTGNYMLKVQGTRK